jgi:hypothetical protein
VIHAGDPAAGPAAPDRGGPAQLLVAALAGALLWRISDEEALMHRAFGAEWEAYAQKSRRALPSSTDPIPADLLTCEIFLSSSQVWT